jgi:SAM-dependent methyltransferase
MSHAHWDKIFENTEQESLGWYESDNTLTWEMLAYVGLAAGRRVFLAGIGTSSLADELAKAGLTLVLNDLSPAALEILRARLPEQARVHVVAQDISLALPEDLPEVDLWVDRAALHFLTEEEAIGGYFQNLRRLVKAGGYVLLAEFADDGAERCAALPVHRYTEEEMLSRLGDGFSSVASRRHVYHNPSGDPRPYVYALFRREDA